MPDTTTGQHRRPQPHPHPVHEPPDLATCVLWARGWAEHSPWLARFVQDYDDVCAQNVRHLEDIQATYNNLQRAINR